MTTRGRRPSAPLLPVLFLCLLYQVPALELEDACFGPLGLESGKIQDSALSASTSYDSGSVGPHHGRLRNNKQGGAWCPRHMVSRNSREFLEINMGQLHVLTGVKTQGRYGNGQGQEYAEQYMIEYWRSGVGKWVRWKDRTGKELLSGNADTSTIVEQTLDPPPICSKIRILPYSDHVRTVCMRVELTGCFWKDGLQAYSMPQGVKRGDLDLTDKSYDGSEENGHLSQGLGQLTDGTLGNDNFKLDLKGLGKGYEWIGWRNDSVGWAGMPLELLFQFDAVRNFSAAHLYTNNMFTKDVQVFSHARAFFSLNALKFSPEPVHFSYMPDLVMEHSRNVTIKLHQRIGKFLKLQLYFASKWILLSEVSFDSSLVRKNFSEDLDLEASPEFPLQRDEDKREPARNLIYIEESSSSTSHQQDQPPHPNGYIGIIIGILTVVILVLVAAITLIVFKSRRNKILAGSEKETIGDERKAVCEKGDVLMYSQHSSSIFSNYEDLVPESYLPEPPPVPPPPRNYLSPSFSPQEDKCPIKEVSSEKLRVIEKIGKGQFGELHLCHLNDLGLCVLYSLEDQERLNEFRGEIGSISRLQHPNVALLLGASLQQPPFFALREYAQFGDLCQFLQDHVAESATAINASILSYGCLIYMATQIASGMEHLELRGFVHKDLAARNCLVGKNYEVKISDLGRHREVYSQDYCLEGVPLRWMAWESALLGNFTSKSDVWSFAVLMWEILTFAREQPFECLSDDKVLENLAHFYQNDGEHEFLNVPHNCPKEIYDLMVECWNRNESDRPAFREIHLFLQRKNLGFKPTEEAH
ncbi:discoidin domain-containing receptor 2 isoform X1 [Euwallacea similis]|uniref:discoidin domain-containing receptor 2 isoform X1 n=1 Tax=Euwallacea similis TaxID=1736056 RepID=UPI00344EF3C1